MSERKPAFLFVDSADRNNGTFRIFFDNCRRALEQQGCATALNDVSDSRAYDVIVCRATDERVPALRRDNPHALLGALKPQFIRDARPELARAFDFLVAGSLFERDLLLGLGLPVLVLRHLEIFPPGIRHQVRDEPFGPSRKAVLGYHGNRLHLEQFGYALRPALEEVDSAIPIRLVAIWDRAGTGPWVEGRPAVEITEIQWDEGSWPEELSRCDVGLVPNASWPKARSGWQRLGKGRPVGGEWYGADPTDLVLRWKTTANAGRAFVFMQLGVPVVADPIPEVCEVFGHGERGVIATTREGWREGILGLLRSASERRQLSAAGLDWAATHLTPRAVSEAWLRFLDAEFDLAGRPGLGAGRPPA